MEVKIMTKSQATIRRTIQSLKKNNVCIKKHRVRVLAHSMVQCIHFPKNRIGSMVLVSLDHAIRRSQVLSNDFKILKVFALKIKGSLFICNNDNGIVFVNPTNRTDQNESFPLNFFCRNSAK